MAQTIDELSQAVALNLATKGYLQPQKRRRTRTNWESKLVREYLVKFHQKDLKWVRHEIGPYDPTKPEEFNGQLRRWADALVDINDTILLIECKMRPDHRAISQIDLYRRIFPQTPEFEYYKDKPLRCMLLTTSVDYAVKELCERWDIEYEVYIPTFFEEYQQMMIERYRKSEYES